MFSDASVTYVLSKISTIAKKAASNELAAIAKATLFLRAESQKLCPVVTGTLKNSIYTKVYNLGPNKVEGIIGYSAKYAIYVHENPRAGQVGKSSTPAGAAYSRTYRPKKRKKSKAKVFSTVGQWKFLETPVKERANDVFAIMAAEMAR